MSRNARIFAENGIYHIMFRGINKQNIFFEDRDYIKFLKILTDLKDKFNFELYSYCLMSNHVHFVLKENEIKDISRIIHGLLTKYARWFNIKYERTGALLEGRYKSKPVKDDEYFMHLIRYIHQNPKKAGIVDYHADYKWSSYSEYMSDGESLIDKDLLLDMLPAKMYVEFHNEDEEQNFNLCDNSNSKDIELINELKKLGICPPTKLGYLPPDEFTSIIKSLDGRFSQRRIVRVTGVSRNRFRQNVTPNGDGCKMV